MPEPSQADQRNDPSFTMRRSSTEEKLLREKTWLNWQGASSEEIAQTVIQQEQYSTLDCHCKRGDEVIGTKQDYPNMINA